MIGKKEVQHIAQLARLGLSSEEMEKMQTELAAILDYVNLLNEVDVANVEPTSHPILVDTVMREDKVIEEKAEVVRNLMEQAPDNEGGYVRVKGVLK